MDNNGVTLFGTGVDFGSIQPMVQEEEESDGEVERQREEELKNELENAFDDLTEDEQSFQENSSMYSKSHIRGLRDSSLLSNGDSRISMQSKINSENVQEIPKEYTYNRKDPSSNVQQHSYVWSDVSDNSGNFIHQRSIIASPTCFSLNMNDVVSHSENSGSDTGHDIPVDEFIRSLPMGNMIENSFSKQYCYTNEGTQTQYLFAETSYDQLKLLYEERGRELDKITDELNALKVTSSKDIHTLKNELALVNEENQILQINKNDAKILLTDHEGRIRDLSDDLREKEKKCQSLEFENKELKTKLNVTEGTINNLERHVVELQSIDSIAKSRQAHDEFLRKLKMSHEEQTEEMKRKLKMAIGKAEESDREAKSLQEELNTVRRVKEFSLKEQADIIQQLNLKLESAKQQIQVLMKTNIKESDGVESELKERLNIAEKELEHQKNELNNYHILVKLGLFQSISSAEDTCDQFSFKKRLNFDDSVSRTVNVPENTDQQDLKNVNEKLKKELLQILLKNKKYKEVNDKLNESLSEKQKQMRVMQSELKSMKKDVSAGEAPELQHDILILENMNLKKELIGFIQHLQSIKEKGEDAVHKFMKFAEKNDLSLNNSLMSPTLQLQNFIKGLEGFGKLHHLMWDEFKEEYLQLNSKYFIVINSLSDVKECLNNLILKGVPDSSEHRTLKQLIDNFVLSIKQLRESQALFRDGVKLQNELLTNRIELEGSKAIIQELENSMKRTEEEKMQTIKYCKEKYLKYHESAISNLKSKLESEYNTLKASYEEELKSKAIKLQEVESNYAELVCEKSKLQETLNKRIISKENEELVVENIIKENEDLREKLKLFETKCSEIENNYKISLEALQRSGGINSIGDNIELLEAKKRLEDLLQIIQVLQTEIERREKEKNYIENELHQLQTNFRELEENKENGDKNISFSQFHDANERYKKLYNDLRDEKEKLKTYYEKQIKDLQEIVELHKNVSNDSHLINNTKKYEDEITSLKNNILTLSSTVATLGEEKKKLEEGYNKEEKKWTVQFKEQEQCIKDLKQEKEMQLVESSKNIHEIMVEKLKYKKHGEYLYDKVKTLIEKYKNLKRNFFALKSNFNKLQTIKKSREELILNELKRITKEQFDDNESQFEGFQNWLIKCRTILAEEVTRVIDQLSCIPEKAVESSVMKPSIDNLAKIKIAILKLEIRVKEGNPPEI